MKVSYSACKSVASHIAQRNHRIMEKQVEDKEKELCNCRGNKSERPLPRACLTPEIVYQSLITSGTEAWNYFGETSQTFKKRWTAHKSNIKNRGQAGTDLSAKVWELKDAGRDYEIKNSIVRRSKTCITSCNIKIP